MAKKTKEINVGGVRLGGGNPVVIQSMTNTPTQDIEKTLGQIQRLAQAGCQLVRLAVPDEAAARALKILCARSPVPLVADIHFDYRLALLAVEAGIAKIRINPGNIGGEERVRQVARACRAAGVPIRIGVNSGSVERDLLERYGGPVPQALVESALRHVALLEKYGFDDICLSLKSSRVVDTIAAYEQMSDACDYPLHLGVTEAGGARLGLIKSAIGIGSLLAKGIGDTIRVSLTDDPVEEVRAAQDILKALDLHESGVTVISCPTCGRTQIDLMRIAREVEERTAPFRQKWTVAVMGCAVNGPGEARQADFGIAGGRGEGLVFRRGEILCKVPQEHLVDALLEQLRRADQE